MHADTDIVVGDGHRLGRVQSHAHAYRSLLRPVVIRQCDLRVERTAKRVLCAAERDEHRVARASEIVTAMARERVAQQRPVLVQHRAVALGAELREQLRRAFDIAEQERHGAGRSHRDRVSSFHAADWRRCKGCGRRSAESSAFRLSEFERPLVILPRLRSAPPPRAIPMIERTRKFLDRLGPGLITGAADDDPSGIATYSQAGAQFGLNMLWPMLFTYPLMVAVQAVCARVGRVTGQGLAFNLREVFPNWAVVILVALLFVANTINIGADIAAMGASAQLLAGHGQMLFTVMFAAVSLALQVLVPYHRYVKMLKWLTLVLFA